MSVFQAILIGLCYYLANSPWPFGGLGNYAILYRPMVSGLVVGLILGDPVTGTIIGATINLGKPGKRAARKACHKICESGKGIQIKNNNQP
jgi:mannose/fructose/N-acetylgalactosamine-specific phosphotransferase system component IIC